jgi:hypothetical protein
MQMQSEEDTSTSALLNKVAWLEALAALELEFIAFQRQRSSPIPGDIAPSLPQLMDW